MSATGQGVEGRGEVQHCAAAGRTARASTPEPGSSTNTCEQRSRLLAPGPGRGHAGPGAAAMAAAEGGEASGEGGEEGQGEERPGSRPASAAANPRRHQQPHQLRSRHACRIQEREDPRDTGGTNRPINSGETRAEEEMQGRRQWKSTSRSYT